MHSLLTTLMLYLQNYNDLKWIILFKNFGVFGLLFYLQKHTLSWSAVCEDF